MRYCTAYLVLFLVVSCLGDTTPQQIHLALTENIGEVVVGWMTNEDTKTSTVIYWPENNSAQNLSAVGTQDYYVMVLPPYESPSIHFVKLTGLQPDSVYSYICGDESGGWSDEYHFRTEPSSFNRPVVIASIGDHGTSNNSVGIVNSLLKSGYNFDFLIHAGDISYANGIQKYWDIWGNMVQPFASTVPWMVAVGNHEILDDMFIAYQHRFKMPGNGGSGNLYYSFNYGPAHIVMLSSESLDYWHTSSQYEWLEADLKSVDRTSTPWIIALWHSPWYCTNHAHFNSGADMKYYFEDLLYKYKVDLVLNGHVHAYERTYPVYNNTIVEDAPVFITNGVGGTEEGLATGWYADEPWVAFKAAHWGFGSIEIYNSTHLHWKMHQSPELIVSDDFWFIRNH